MGVAGRGICEWADGVVRDCSRRKDLLRDGGWSSHRFCIRYFMIFLDILASHQHLSFDSTFRHLYWVSKAISLEYTA